MDLAPADRGRASLPSSLGRRGRMSVATRYARIAGVLYLVVITCGLFSEVLVRGRLVDFGNASRTAREIAEHQWLFRLGFAADLIVFLSDVALAVLLYFLFRTVSNVRSLTAAGFRIVQTAILGANLLFMFAALLVLTDAEYLGDFSGSQTDSLALLLLEMHKYGYILALTFFGVHAILIGMLVHESGFAPRWLGLVLVLAGLGYISDGVTHFLIEGYDGGASWVLLAPAFVAEIGFCIWLLIARLDIDVEGSRPGAPERAADRSGFGVVGVGSAG